MKWISTSTWVWMLFLAATPSFGAGPAEPAPEAVFSQPSFQFESVLEGQPVTHDFIVRNRGDAELQIEKIKTG
jgi:hypothetical protein